MEKEQLIDSLKKDLLVAIPKAVKRIDLAEGDKVCYISLLGTDHEGESVLGLITLGLESYRDKIFEEESNSEDLKWVLWNSGEMPCNYQTDLEDEDDPTFSEKQENLMELFGEDDWEECWEACQSLRFEVAFELNSYDWSEVFPVTDDFVVYSDWEDLDVESGDLLRSIPKAKYELLVKKGLV